MCVCVDVSIHLFALSLNMSLQLDWLVSELQRSACPLPPYRTGITGVHHCAQLLCGSWDSNSGPNASVESTLPTERSLVPPEVSSEKCCPLPQTVTFFLSSPSKFVDCGLFEHHGTIMSKMNLKTPGEHFSNLRISPHEVPTAVSPNAETVDFFTAAGHNIQGLVAGFPASDCKYFIKVNAKTQNRSSVIKKPIFTVEDVKDQNSSRSLYNVGSDLQSSPVSRSGVSQSIQLESHRTFVKMYISEPCLGSV